MFCPKCRAEYKEGFHTCSDCHIELVDELPPEPEPEFINFIEILGTYNPADVVFLKSLLESEGIQVVDNQIIDFEKHFWDPFKELG